MVSSGASDTRRGADRRGRRAEALAALWLLIKGYRILARRYKTPVGEVDLIAARGRLVAFVEVKARGERSAGLEAITARQQQRCLRAALWYLQRNPGLRAYSQRFDAVVVRGCIPWHVKDAWRA